MHAYEFRADNNSTEYDINVSFTTASKGTPACRFHIEHMLSTDMKFHVDYRLLLFGALLCPYYI